MEKYESPATTRPLLGRRTIIKGAAWSVPAIAMVGATPAFAQSILCGLDRVLLLATAVHPDTSSDWVNVTNVLGVDGDTTTTVDDESVVRPLAVHQFEVPENWSHLRQVEYVQVNIRYRADTLAYGPRLTLEANYGSGSSDTKTDIPTTDEVHSVEMYLSNLDLSQWAGDSSLASDLKITATPAAGTPLDGSNPTTFEIDAIFLSVGYRWHVDPAATECPPYW